MTLKSHINGVRTTRTAFYFLVWSFTTNYEILLKAVCSFLAFVPPNPFAFCTNSSTFLMSVDTKRFTVLKAACLSPLDLLCRHCHLCFLGNQGHGPEGHPSLKDSVTVELQHFGASVTIELSVLVAFFNILSSYDVEDRY